MQPQEKPLKPKKCKACKSVFEPRSSWQVACGMLCALALSQAKKAKEQAKARAHERKADKAKRESLKTRSDRIKEAQFEFNRYVRLRDAGKPCICCGLPLELDAVGGGFDCGHYRSVGSAPHLRFDERNAHGQRKRCNRYGAGRAVDYRVGLIHRIGLEAVEDLESSNQPARFTEDELISIKTKFRSMANALKKETA